MINNKAQFTKGLLIGALAILLLFFVLKKYGKITDTNTQNDYYVLKNQITKMNKMVVLEQDFSTIQKTKVTIDILGNQVSENEIIAFTKTNTQVSYDLNKMKLEVDSVNKKLIIQELPNADIRITPVVEIQSIDDSFFNRIDDEQIKKVTKSAKDDAYKKVDQNKLKNEGKIQLTENLNSIFVLAKALNYKIEDKTNSLDLSKL